MEPNEYLRLAMRTRPLGQTPIEGLVNAALGIAGEFGEIVQINETESVSDVVEECGDQLWYVAQACDALSLDFTEIIEQSGNTIDLLILIAAVGSIAEIAKKAMFHDHPVDEANYYRLGTCLRRTTAGIKMTLGRFDATIEEAMAANIRKLRRRYPDGFSPEASLNRGTA